MICSGFAFPAQQTLGKVIARLRARLRVQSQPIPT